MRDRRVALIAYGGRDLARDFSAVPVQSKTFSVEVFRSDPHYEKTAGLVVVCLWNVMPASRVRAFVIPYESPDSITDRFGWARAVSWKKDGNYPLRHPSSLRERSSPSSRSIALTLLERSIASGELD